MGAEMSLDNSWRGNPYDIAMPGRMCAEEIGRPGSVACSHYDSTRGPEMENPDWMYYLPDDMPLSQLSIPGTHRSLSLFGAMNITTQTWDLPTQLYAGIRYLDIRVRVNRFTRALHVFHGLQDQQSSVVYVLEWVVHYLKEHPGEVIFIRIRLDRENKPAYIPRDKTLPKEVGRDVQDRVIMDLGDENQVLFEEIQNLVDHGSPFGKFAMKVTDDPNILLGAARGKFIIVQDFAGPTTTLMYDDDFEVVDPHYINSLDDDALKKRRKIITDHLKNANSSSKKDRYYLTYTSADGPPFSDIHPFRASMFLNAEVLDFLEKRAGEVNKLGIIAMDFPGQILVSAIIHTNFNTKRIWNRKKKKVPTATLR